MSAHRKLDVHRDGRTLEQNRLDMLNNLGARGRQLAYPDPWCREIVDWVDMSMRHMQEDMRRMHDSMCSLLPLTIDGVDPWGGPLHRLAAITGSPSGVVDRMEQDMRAMQREMDSAMTSAFPEAGDMPTGAHDSLTGCRAMDLLKDNYRIGDDGKMYLSVNFNTKDFAPEDIHVTTSNNRLVVQGKKTVQTENSRSSKQFYRRIDLPHSVDPNALQCRLSEDGVLSVDVPVKEPDYKSLKFDGDRRLMIKPNSEPDGHLCVTGKEGVTEVSDGKGGRKVHLEVTVPAGYTANDVSVRVEQKQLIVSGKLDQETGAKKKFTESYTVPETLDPMTITARLCGNVLVVEAPLISPANPH